MNGCHYRVLRERAIGLAVTLLLICVCHTAHGYGGEEHGPRFVVEPPVSIFFSNATGARVECAAEGTPRPLVRWQMARDGSTVRDVGELMRVDDNGTLVFSPFAEHQYAPEVHAAAYRCVAHSRAGTIVSRTVQVRAEVIRNFEPVVRDTVTMPGNVAVFNCHIPGVSYNENNVLPESVAITSWVQDGVFNIFPSWEIDSKIIMIPKTGQLRIANVDENDLRHSYTCRIVNKLTGFTQESSTFGRIYFESNRTMAPWSKSNDFTVHMVKQGDHLLLPCDVYGFPPPKVTWSSGTSTVVVTADAAAMNAGSAANGRGNKAPMNFLRLRSVQRTDAGNYTCVAKNAAGSKSLHHRVIVTPDMSAHVVPALAEIESGRTVSFTCITSSADENQIVVWLKDGVPRQTSQSTPPTYTLNVDSVQKDDQGMYQCVVTNKLNNEMAHSFAELRLSEGEDKCPAECRPCSDRDSIVRTGVETASKFVQFRPSVRTRRYTMEEFARRRTVATAVLVIALSVAAAVAAVVHGGILTDNNGSPRIPIIPRLTTTLWPQLSGHYNNIFKHRPMTPTPSPDHSPNGNRATTPPPPPPPQTKPAATANNGNDKSHEQSKNRLQERTKQTSKPAGNETHGRGVQPSRTETTSKKTVKLETTTQDRSIITAPLITCPEGQRMSPDRRCEADVFVDPEDGD